ncbi:phosphoribosylamine--glycine ligase [Candidatus Undinarchaeota archaeon]
MKVLVVGSGAREHAIAESIKNSGGTLYSVLSSKNPGMVRISEEYKVCDLMDNDVIRKFAEKHDITLAVVGPEAPLANGLVDELIMDGIDCVGPRKTLARLESDKAFMRNLMETNKIPGCPEFHILIDSAKAEDIIRNSGKEWALKPAGLTGGKGVQMMGEHVDVDGAVEYAKNIIDNRVGGMAKLVLEERLKGEEITIQAFADGKTLIPMPVVQDHKRAFDGDKGPNTGGMGSYSDSNHLLPFLDQATYDKCVDIMKKTMDAVVKMTGLPYKGILYGQFMLTKDGPKVIEYNARFGDPEAMNVLNLLESDPLQIFKNIAQGELKESDVKFKQKATVCKYVAPEGYPSEPKATTLVVDEDAINKLGAKVYFASVSEKNKKLTSGTSRTAAVIGIADTIEDAEKIAEQAIAHIDGKLFHRKDIGTKELVQRRVDNMKKIMA